MLELIYYTNMLAFLGASMGSFITCWAYRFNRGISIVTVKDSHCDNCNKKLNTIELLPILGTIITNGKCKKCGTVYSKLSFKVEIVFAILTPSMWYLFNPTLPIGLIVVIYLMILYMTFSLITAYDSIKEELVEYAN